MVTFLIKNDIFDKLINTILLGFFIGGICSNDHGNACVIRCLMGYKVEIRLFEFLKFNSI